MLQTVACRGGDELFAERLRFEPARARPDVPGMLGGWDYLVSVTVLAPERDLTALAEAINTELATRSNVHGGAGALPRQAGAFARVLAPDAVSAADAIWCVWAIARRCLLGVPPPIRSKVVVRVRQLIGSVHAPPFRDRRVVTVPVAWDEASRRRLRRTAADGTDVVIELDDGGYLADGAVLTTTGSGCWSPCGRPSQR